MTFGYQTPTQPDILEVIADLSNDEVRTPPSVANAVLDLLPAEVWTDSTLRWLDPGVKTGVFLREITKRLLVGLAAEIPDEDKRLEHILKNQVFGIAITELTALMGRRTLYCSKDASRDNSIVKMDTASGNLWFERTRHLFAKGRCTVCGASEEKFDAGTKENYAYAFIHEHGRLRYKEDHEMKFDIVVGNPPYQMEGGGGGINDTAIYQHFVEYAIQVSARYVALIIPSRWMSSGRGLESFRSMMLESKKIVAITDFPNGEDVFPGVSNEGGVCYFLWDNHYSGKARIKSVRGAEVVDDSVRDLHEFDVLVRDSRAIAILRKVISDANAFVSAFASADTPFGLASNFAGYTASRKKSDDLVLIGATKGKRFRAFVPRFSITKNRQDIDAWKVLVPLARGGTSVPDQVIGLPEITEPGAICTQTFRYFGPFADEVAAKSFDKYLQTRFVRFLIALRKNSQNTYRETYNWVPNQTWDREWTDAELYKKYGITKDEQAYIESMIKEMPA